MILFEIKGKTNRVFVYVKERSIRILNNIQDVTFKENFVHFRLNRNSDSSMKFIKFQAFYIRKFRLND